MINKEINREFGRLASKAHSAMMGELIIEQLSDEYLIEAFHTKLYLTVYNMLNANN